MRIGILTMYYARNYGGILQAYGLAEFLKSHGHQVILINYKNSGRSSISSIISKLERRIHERRTNSMTTPPREKLSPKYLNNFIDFKNNKLSYSQPVDEVSISSVTDNLDAIVIGSDQIWNDVFSNKMIFYGEWTYTGRKIAYAACTVLENIPYNRKNRIRNLLKKFSVITVRDRHTAEFISKLLHVTPPIVVDPSCLYDYHDFIKDDIIGRPYILTYILSNEISGGNNRAIKIIKNAIGDLPVVSVCIPSVSTVSKNISDIFLPETSPEEWVNLFYHASFVFTDSFHGIMFSMKFRKPFIAYMRDGQRRSRIQDLKEKYQLENIITNVNEIESVFTKGVIDYSQIELLLDKDTSQSAQILLDAINA